MNGYRENTKLVQKNSQGEIELGAQNSVESPKKFRFVLSLTEFFSPLMTSFFSSVYWDYAISINMSSIVYLHCHQHSMKDRITTSFFHSLVSDWILGDGDRIVFIGRDGVQYPPFHIKDKGGHLLSFLTCLENSLAPHGQIDPPLWYEQGQGTCGFNLVVSQFSISLIVFLGKIFPKLYRRTEQRSSMTSTDEDVGETSQADRTDEEITSPTGDYVFRIVLLADR